MCKKLKIRFAVIVAALSSLLSVAKAQVDTYSDGYWSSGRFFRETADAMHSDDNVGTEGFFYEFSATCLDTVSNAITPKAYHEAYIKKVDRIAAASSSSTDSHSVIQVATVISSTISETVGTTHVIEGVHGVDVQGNQLSPSERILKGFEAVTEASGTVTGLGASSLSPEMAIEDEVISSSAKTQIVPNAAQGKAAEYMVAKQLAADGKLLGTQVSVNTSLGLRILDNLTKDGSQLMNVEVKSGNATRTATQVAKDNAMATEGGTIVGKNAPANLRGKTVIIKTEIQQVPVNQTQQSQ